MQATVWTEQMQSDLRGAFRRGKYAAARRAFPLMTRGQVQSAIRRFVFDFDTANADIAADGSDWMIGAAWADGAAQPNARPVPKARASDRGRR